MTSLARQNCLNHFEREAVAQCPECRHFFCRECITEHDDRILCASCLRKISTTAKERRHSFQSAKRGALSVAGIITAALFFYWVGQLLLLIPTEFHDGSLWQSMGDLHR